MDDEKGSANQLRGAGAETRSPSATPSLDEVAFVGEEKDRQIALRGEREGSRRPGLRQESRRGLKRDWRGVEEREVWSEDQEGVDKVVREVPRRG